jgi:hypothetical protein
MESIATKQFNLDANSVSGPGGMQRDHDHFCGEPLTQRRCTSAGASTPLHPRRWRWG